MKEYNVLEADYNKANFESREEALEKAKQNTALLKDCLESDPFLKQSEEARVFDFLEFAFNCNIVAAQARGEISVALDPDSNSASVVIIAELVELRHPVSALFARAINLSDYFSVESVEEESFKTILYFHFLF